jgi:hypothetical protein
LRARRADASWGPGQGARPHRGLGERPARRRWAGRVGGRPPGGSMLRPPPGSPYRQPRKRPSGAEGHNQSPGRLWGLRDDGSFGWHRGIPTGP